MALRGCGLAAVLLALALAAGTADAFDILDPTGNVTVTYDIMTWTIDGYVASVTINNFQQFRRIGPPGWTLSWNWTKTEFIWTMQGAEAKYQGDCTNAIDPMDPTRVPHSCEKIPIILDLVADINRPYTDLVANCCKSGVLAAWAQDVNNSASTFQMAIGNSSHTLKTVRVPQNFSIGVPGYSCTPPHRAVSSTFTNKDSNHISQALATWVVTCTYSQTQENPMPTCCVSFSAFYNRTFTKCNDCACNCANFTQTSTGSAICTRSLDASELLATGKRTAKESQLMCSSDGCPTNVHWHIKTNYKEYWRAKITIINRDIVDNHTDWNLVVQHYNFRNLTTTFDFDGKLLQPYHVNDTGVFWGKKYYNDLLLPAGPDGNVQSEVLFRKDGMFTLSKGWAFPKRVAFNGDYCVMPTSFPTLPGSANQLLLPTAVSFAVVAGAATLLLLALL
eukprot:SM000124S25904  [mRNA]  locus=s124:60697:63359:+ [translate_table: standard]